MWTNKYKKAITFSFDDGITQDIRLVEILNRYGLKATFNINTGLTTTAHDFTINGLNISHLDLETMRDLYSGHEVAVHSHTHPDLTRCTEDEIRYELKTNIDMIKEVFHIEPVGMAYPYGTFNDEVVSIIQSLNLCYARTIIDSHDTLIQTDLLRFRPTAHFNDPKLPSIVEQFLKSSPDTPQILYIWGHSYECDTDHLWTHFEDLCKQISHKKDVFYGTNSAVLL